MNTGQKEAAKPGGGDGGERDSQHGEENHTGAEPSTAVWFKLYPARWAGLAMREPDNAKLGDRVRNIIIALCEQKPGADSFADEVMHTTAEAMKAASEHARKAAAARWNKSKSGYPSNARASDGEVVRCPSNAKRRDLEDEKRRGLSTEPKKGTAPESVYKSLGIGNSRGDLKEIIAGLSHDDLPQWAAEYCQEADLVQAVFAYKKAIRTIGPEAFRRELDSFVAEVEAGEEPDSRGRAFMARIQALVKAKGERG